MRVHEGALEGSQAGWGRRHEQQQRKELSASCMFRQEQDNGKQVACPAASNCCPLLRQLDPRRMWLRDSPSW
jgi:hypothetical protein